MVDATDHATMTPSQATQDRLRSKSKLSVGHLFILLAGLAYLVTTCTLLSTGLRGFGGIINNQLDEITFELRAQSNIAQRENALEIRMDKLEHMRLGSRFMETYEGCLVRGVQQADWALEDSLDFRGFQYPTFRNRTIDWTVQNCGRLHRAPLIPVVAQPLTCARLTARLRMPDGFRLDGEAPPCRLKYVHVKELSRDLATRDMDALADTMLKVEKLRRILRDIYVVSGVTESIAALLKWLEILCLILYVVSLFASEFALNQGTPGDWVRTSVAALRSLRVTRQNLWAALLILARINVARIGGLPQHALMTMLLYSFMSGTSVAAFPQMYRALKELYGIVKQPDVLTIQALVPIPHTQSDGNTGKHTGIPPQPDVLANGALVPMPRTQSDTDIFTHTQILSQPDEASVPSQELKSAASSSHAEFETKVDEPHMQNLANDTGDETEYFTQSEGSDSPSGDEDYVDLAGGISPTISDDMDWAVVDA